MSKLNHRLVFRLSRVGLSITLGLTLLIGLLLLMNDMSKVSQASSITKGVEADIESADLTAQESFTTVVVLTPTALLHEFQGAGVHIFDSDYLSSAFTSTLEALGLKYIRVQFGPDWNKLSKPPLCTDENREQDFPVMYDFVTKNYTGDFSSRLTNTLNIATVAQNLGIETIFLNWRAHHTWHVTKTNELITAAQKLITNTHNLTDTHELKEEYVDDYACFVTQIAKFLTDKGVMIRYLEPTNEPSDNEKDTKIPPTLYNTFVKLLKKYLTEEGLTKIEILGPGLAYLNHDNTVITWTMALDNIGVDALAEWAAHAWDPKFFTVTAEPKTLRTKWQEFHKAIKAKEKPGQPKPIFITEFGCANDPRNGVCAVENMVTLLDLGANAVVYWHLREQSWDPANRERALLTETYAEKPMLTAFRSALPFIAGDDVKVVQLQTEGRITAAAFNRTDPGLGKKQTVIVLVNNFTETETILIDFTTFYTVAVRMAALYDDNTNTIITKGLGFIPCPLHNNSGRAKCEKFSLPPKTILILSDPYNLYLPSILKSYN